MGGVERWLIWVEMPRVKSRTSCQRFCMGSSSSMAVKLKPSASLQFTESEASNFHIIITLMLSR